MKGTITKEELNNVRGKIAYSMYKKFQDLNDYMRGECDKENKKRGTPGYDSYNKVDMKVKLDWDWELFDYAYFATKVVADNCEVMHSPWQYVPNGGENMVGYKKQGFDRRTHPGAFSYFAEAGQDAYSQEGHKYHKFFDSDGNTINSSRDGNKKLFRIGNHYTNINHANNDKYACFFQFSNSCPYSIGNWPVYGGIYYCYYRKKEPQYYSNTADEYYGKYLGCRNHVRIPGHGNGRSTSYDKGVGSGVSSLAASIGGADWGTQHAPDDLQDELNVEGDSSKPETKVVGDKFDCKEETACLPEKIQLQVHIFIQCVQEVDV